MGKIPPSHLINMNYRYCHVININNMILCIALLNMIYTQIKWNRKHGRKAEVETVIRINRSSVFAF